MKRLLFGTAGIPVCAKGKDTTGGISVVKELGLDAMELEFVRSVNISKEKAPLVKKSAKKNKITLTCHGQYYINLNSLDAKKIDASKERVLKAARIANLCGAWSLCFHAAFYMGKPKDTAYENVKKNLAEIIDTLKNEGNSIWIRPELTGKQSQFGDLNELLRLSQESEQVAPCIDFSHYHARTQKYNSHEEFSGILLSVEKSLGKDAIKNMHMHLSGIAYGKKGEQHHLVLKDSDMRYRELLKALKDFSAKGVLICESPNIEEDAKLLKKTYERL